MKYLNTYIGFQEFPDEISLLINITNCPHRCDGCHSPELWKNVGTELTKSELSKLIESNKGITLVGFMGGDANPSLINTFAAFIKNNYSLKVGWYSGNDISKDIGPWNFDYIKLGSYIKEKGGLDNPNTNQKMYKKIEDASYHDFVLGLGWEDITYKFWKHGRESQKN